MTAETTAEAINEKLELATANINLEIEQEAKNGRRLSRITLEALSRDGVVVLRFSTKYE